MPNSIEKLNEIRKQAAQPPPADADPIDLMLSTLALKFGPALDHVIPDDPMVLDEMLRTGAEKLCELRSDHAPRLEVTTIAQVQEAELVE
jgi:hypothetical protein